MLLLCFISFWLLLFSLKSQRHICKWKVWKWRLPFSFSCSCVEFFFWANLLRIKRKTTLWAVVKGTVPAAGGKVGNPCSCKHRSDLIQIEKPWVRIGMQTRVSDAPSVMLGLQLHFQTILVTWLPSPKLNRSRWTWHKVRCCKHCVFSYLCSSDQDSGEIGKERCLFGRTSGL